MKLKAKYKEIKNEEKQGIELYFETIPDYADRKELKENGYKWHNVKKCWYKKENVNIVKKAEKIINELGVKVGDIFESSWRI